VKAEVTVHRRGGERIFAGRFVEEEEKTKKNETWTRSGVDLIYLCKLAGGSLDNARRSNKEET
jgi:hypothetical protein